MQCGPAKSKDYAYVITTCIRALKSASA